MDFYEFAVTNFRINDTRVLHQDSLYLTHTVYADGDVIAATPNPVSLSGVVINGPQAKVSFVFRLLNAGNG